MFNPMFTIGQLLSFSWFLYLYYKYHIKWWEFVLAILALNLYALVK